MELWLALKRRRDPLHRADRRPVTGQYDAVRRALPVLRRWTNGSRVPPPTVGARGTPYSAGRVGEETIHPHHHGTRERPGSTVTATRDPYTRSGSPAARPPARRPSTSPTRGTARLVGTVSVPTEAQVEEAVAAAHAAATSFAATPAHVRGRRARPRLPAAGRARRGDRPADHRRERQADQVGARRGRPRGLGVPLGRRGGPPLQRRRGAAPGHRPGRHRPARADPALPARARCSGIAPFNFPLNLVRAQGRPGASRSARRSSSSRRPATPLSALLLGELLAETDLPAGSWSVLPVPNDRMPALVAGPAAAGDLLHRLRHGRLRDPGLGAAQARHPGARRQRARPWCSPTGPRRRTWTGRRPGSRPSPTTRAASPASRCSG